MAIASSKDRIYGKQSMSTKENAAAEAMQVWSTITTSFEIYLYPYELVLSKQDLSVPTGCEAHNDQKLPSHDRRPNSGWIGSPSWTLPVRGKEPRVVIPTVSWSVSMTICAAEVQWALPTTVRWRLVAGCTRSSGVVHDFNTSMPVVSKLGR